MSSLSPVVICNEIRQIMRNDGSMRSSILFTRDLLYLSYLLVLLFPVEAIGFGVIQTNHSLVFHYTGELCNTLEVKENLFYQQINLRLVKPKKIKQF